MENEPDESAAKVQLHLRQLTSNNISGFGRSNRDLQLVLASPYLEPIFYVVLVAWGDRSFLGLFFALVWMGYLATGIALLIPGVVRDQPPRGPAMLTALAWQAAGLAPWLVLPLVWSSLTTSALIVAFPIFAAWGMAGLLFADGEGTSLKARARTSECRILAMIAGGLWAFALFVAGLIVIIKASHPLR